VPDGNGEIELTLQHAEAFGSTTAISPECGAASGSSVEASFVKLAAIEVGAVNQATP
jgi:hypothetical protein